MHRSQTHSHPQYLSNDDNGVSAEPIKSSSCPRGTAVIGISLPRRLHHPYQLRTGVLAFLPGPCLFLQLVHRKTGWPDSRGGQRDCRALVRFQRAPYGMAYWDAIVLLALYVVSALMISELKKLYQRERELSRMDP